MFLEFRMGLWLALIAFVGGGFTAAHAQPQLPDYASPIRGHVRYLVEGEGLVPLPAATIEVWLKRTLVMETQTNDDGEFKLDRLPNPATPRDGFIVVARPAREDADLGAAATAFVIDPDNGKAPSDLDFVLEPAKTRRIRIVTLADKTPVAGATLSVLQLNVALPQGGGNWPLPVNNIKPQTSDAEGVVNLAGVPMGAMAELQARQDEYADNIVRLKQGQAGTTIPLALESRVFGRVTLGGEEPLVVPQWQIKMQGLTEPWRTHWRTGNLNARGEYVIENVAPPAITGESSYLINLELRNNFDPAPGIHGEYIAGSWDAMVTVQRDGQARRYVAYLEGNKSGLVFNEGSDVRHDFNLEPLALVVGQTQPNATLTYRNPRSGGRWRNQADARGSFEFPLPTGDVSLQVGERRVEVKGLKPHETRDVGQID